MGELENDTLVGKLAEIIEMKNIYDLSDSDNCIGSYLKQSDITEITGLSDLSSLTFKDGVIDENIVRKWWYALTKTSFDEILLMSIIKRTYPMVQIKQQVKVGKFSMDLQLDIPNRQPVFIEFDGPSHFAPSRYGVPTNDPFRKKKMVEDATGIEVVNWPYWIHRCTSNVQAIFDKLVIGKGAIWSSNIHFGMFVFSNSAQIVDEMNKRFNAVSNSGCGYFYETPEHPVISKILNRRVDINILLPNGYIDKNYWLPKQLQNENPR